MASRAFETFVAPARARPQLWRLVVGIALSVLIFFLGSAAVFNFAWLAFGEDANPWLFNLWVALGDTPLSALTLLASFLGMAVAPMVVVRLLHARSPATLFGPRVRVLRDFVLAASATACLLAVSLLVWSFAYDAVPGLPPRDWLKFLPFALAGVLLQSGAEELFFRGYLQQQLAARFASPLAWAVLPAALFAVGHHDPAMAGANVWAVVATTGIFGLVAADLTARTGSIGAAWGLHFANNCFALLVVATEGTLTGLALYRTPYAAHEADLALVLPIDVAVMLLGWWLVRRLVALR